MRFQECYKTLWKCIYNLKNWTGEDAKYFEQCSQSSKVTITMIDKENAEQNYGVFGSADDAVLRKGGSECSPGTGFWPLAKGDLGVEAAFISNLWHYVAAKMNFAPGEMSLIDASNID